MKSSSLLGSHITLNTLTKEHHAALCEVGLLESLWELSPYQVTTPAAMHGYITTALDWQKKGSCLPFVITERATRKIIGCTRLANYDPANKFIELGWTFIHPDWQRSPVNTEAKLLLLTHAFDVLGCIKVGLKTDALNIRSQKAIERIGAKPEGVFRNHMILASGRIRDTAFFSILAAEWPVVKEGLQQRLRATI